MIQAACELPGIRRRHIRRINTFGHFVNTGAIARVKRHRVFVGSCRFGSIRQGLPVRVGAIDVGHARIKELRVLVIEFGLAFIFQALPRAFEIAVTQAGEQGEHARAHATRASWAKWSPLIAMCKTVTGSALSPGERVAAATIDGI